MSPSNDNEFAQDDPLSKHIKKIQSFRDLEEDEELMPVAPREIALAIGVLEAIYTKTKLLPYFIVPTRSGGVGIEYRIKGVEAYYHLHIDGLIRFAVIEQNKTQKQVTFTSPSEAPDLLNLI